MDHPARLSAHQGSSWFARLPLRRKLLLLGSAPLLLALSLAALVLLGWGAQAVDTLLVAKIRSDLGVAQGYFDRVRAEVGGGTLAVAESHALVQALSQGDTAAALGGLQASRQRHGLEFLNLLPPEAVPAANAPAGPQAALVVLSAAQLQAMAPALAPRVPVPLLPTRNATPTQRLQEDRALVLLAHAPVQAADGRRLGLLQGGVLLNRNLPFIDHINEIVYPEGSLPLGSRGTATLFLDDVRISTNVRLFGPQGEQRAIGTRVSQAVREAVLGRGETWLDRAFVVSDWYVSAYLPLTDAAGQRVGMLYVGFLEAPFTRLKLATLGGMAAVFVAVMGLAAWWSQRWARSIYTPIERMTRTMAQVEAGQAGARVGALPPGDELPQLAGHLDHLLDVVDHNTAALKRWGDELDAKVAERTRELQAAQDQLLRSEKLAAIGQLTAGIAHEVNNPIAVIQGNLDLVRELLGPQAQTVRDELALIDQQVERMRLIVTRLLQFARPTEYAGYVQPVDLDRAIDDSLVLVAHPLARSGVVLQRQRGARRPALANLQELQQVLINLIVNALQAMPEGGTLGLATRDLDDGRVAIEVSDTGAGLAPQVADLLFKPFVTTKPDGTGLGLWISRSLLERYDGELRAANRSDGQRGALLRVVLPAEGGAGPEGAA
jgi:signal transduction histidine kinase